MKKNCYWMFFAFIALIFGCAKAVIRADLPKTFPNVQILTEKLDKKEAIAILDKYLPCILTLGLYNWRQRYYFLDLLV